MASEFKVPLKLVVDGESDFKTAMKSCSDAMSTLTAEGKLAAEVYKGQETSLEALAKQQQIATEKYETQKEKVNLLSNALKDELAKSNGEVTDKSISLNKQLLNAQTTMEKLSKEASEASSKYEEHSSVIGKLKDKYASVKDSVNSFAEAHPKATSAMQTSLEVAGKLASGVGTTLKAGLEVGTAAVGAMAAGCVALGKAVFESAEAASTYGDTVDKGSQKMGVSAEQYQQLAYAADLSGTSIKTLQKATVKLQQAGYTGDIDDAIEQLSSMTDETERTAAAQELFGEKIANELAPMLNQGVEAFTAAKTTASDYGLVMSDAAVSASAAFNDTKTTLVDTVSMIKTNLAAELMPGINDVMEGITGLFTGDSSATEKIEKGIETLMDDLDGVVDKVVNILTMLIDKIIEIAPNVIDSLVSGLTGNVGKLLTAALKIVSTLVTDLLTPQNISALVNGAISLINQLVGFLADNAGMIITAAITLVTTLMNSLLEGDNMTTLVNGCIDMVGAIVTALIENAPQLLKAALEMAKALVNALINYDWKSLAKNIFNAIKDSIVGFFGGGSNSNAGGISYVPNDGMGEYVSVLHQGEAVLTAAEADEYRRSKDTNLEAKIDMLLASQGSGDVNINVSGSAGAIVRALNVEIDRESKRKSAWK